MGKKKLGLVLGSGAAKGVAHVGVLQALDEAGLKPDCIVGCSAGSVVGACYAMGMDPQDILQEIMHLKVSEVIDPKLSLKGGFFLTDHMENKLRSIIGNKRICDLEIPFRCIATDLIKGETKIFDGNFDTVKAICASSCIPAVFEPVVIAGEAYIDGSVLQRVPIAAIKDMEPDVIVAVDLFNRNNRPTQYKGPLAVLERAFELMDQDNTERKINAENPDLLITPELSDLSQFSFSDFEEIYYRGYEAGISHLDEIKKLLEIE